MTELVLFLISLFLQVQGFFQDFSLSKLKKTFKENRVLKQTRAGLKILNAKMLKNSEILSNYQDDFSGLFKVFSEHTKFAAK